MNKKTSQTKKKGNKSKKYHRKVEEKSIQSFPNNVRWSGRISVKSFRFDCRLRTNSHFCKLHFRKKVKKNREENEIKVPLDQENQANPFNLNRRLSSFCQFLCEVFRKKPVFIINRYHAIRFFYTSHEYVRGMFDVFVTSYHWKLF